ncbi:glycosyltransferase [Acetobacter cibinongensis]|uniref:glycosyltransferase n=1 Tax=Acetobacter cibinongensis TaxID=146475 RepID=UPI000A3AB75D|nr:glycosyltransferase [Acetobacter cibinongensis]
MHQTLAPTIPSVSSQNSDTIYILLSIYNGALYLNEQLASLEQQNHTDWVLLWRDDGSTDNSQAIMQAFTAKVGHARCKAVGLDNGRHKGVQNSYSTLLAAVPENAMAAFCDQDDVWLPDKLTRGWQALLATPVTQPGLYCARQTLTDRHLVATGLSPHLPSQTSFLEAMTQNIATGCTVILSPAACRLLKASPPPAGKILHDWWAYLMVCAAGGRVVTDNQPVLLYRQHGANTVGSQARFMHRAFAALKRGRHAFMAIFWANTQTLLADRDHVAPQNVQSLLILEKGRHSGLAGLLARFSILRQLPGLKRHGMMEQLVFKLWFLLG